MEDVELRTIDDVLEITITETPVTAILHRVATPSTDSALEIADELHTWLRALDSFFQWQHHPQAVDAKGGLLGRDWTAETRIAHEAILRARQLALSVRRRASPDDFAGELNLDGAGGGRQHSQLALADDALAALDEMLGDADALSEGLLAAPQVNFSAWSGLGRVVNRELQRSAIFAELERALEAHSSRRLHPTLRHLAAEAMPPALGADMLHIFQSLAELLAHLRYVAPLLKADRPLKQALPLLTLIHGDAKCLIAFIEKRALRTNEIEGAVFDMLDGTAYALGMELRKVFAHELSDVTPARHPPLIYSKIENAHGLLRDAFQQSAITLAQTLDPNLNAFDLFDVVRTKQEQSLALRRDIWTLLAVVRGFERDPTASGASLSALLEHCRRFRDGSMQFLMYKDWEAFESFVEELARAHAIADALPVMHRFATYLDTLFGQINMRAVLKDYPFNPSDAPQD